MKILYLQYDGVDWVAKTIRQLIELVQDDAISSIGRTVTDWSELLTIKPRTYLRMSRAMDISMSSGYLPDKETLAAMLNASEVVQLSATSVEVPRSLVTPGVEGQIGRFSRPLGRDHHTITMSELSTGMFGRRKSAQDNPKDPLTELPTEHQTHVTHKSSVRDGSPPEGASAMTEMAPNPDKSPPDFNTTCEDFSSFQGSVDMNELFDTTLADLVVDTGFSTTTMGNETRVTP